MARLFHAYDSATLGPIVGGIDLGSWFGGVIIDAIVAVITWAALQKYEATGKRRSLIPAVVVILPCICFSMVANYEDAALKNPAQYAHIDIFTFPALVLNPLMLSSLPLIVLLLITNVPAVLARPRIKTVAEVEQELARIEYEARISKARTLANADVRKTQLTSWKGAAATLTGREEVTLPSVESAQPDELPWLTAEPLPRALPVKSTRMTKAMWDVMPLRQRVVESGLISPKELSEVLGIGLTHARNLAKEVRTEDGEKRAVPGRNGVPFQAQIDALYARRSKDSFAQAQKLERALGLKKTRVLHAVGDAGDNPTVPLVDEEEVAD